MKAYFFIVFWLVVAGFVLISCTNKQTDTCEDDKIDGEWQSIVNNSNCSREQKGEAYLALGGFDYFDFVTTDDPTLIGVLNLTKDNWQQKHDNFKKATDEVRPTYKEGTNAEKTIFFFGAFLTLYTYITGTLDNGEDGSTAFDGNIEPAEVSFFTGAVLTGGSEGGGDGAELYPTDDFQFKQGDSYYLINKITMLNALPEIYNDDLADGIKDSTVDDPIRVANLADTATWTELNQVVHMDSLTDPFASSGTDFNIDNIRIFSTNLLNYLTDIEQSMISLGIDASADAIETITEFRNIMDNGAKCDQLNDNPGLRIIQVLASNSRKEEILDGGSYADVNVFPLTTMTDLGETSEFDTSSFAGVQVTPGIKVLFKVTQDTYIPYWVDASTDVKTAMENLSAFGTTNVKSGDNEIAFPEIICAAELFSK